MNFPKDWIDEVRLWLFEDAHMDEIGSMKLAPKILAGLYDLGALKEPPEPKVIRWCETHNRPEGTLLGGAGGSAEVITRIPMGSCGEEFGSGKCWIVDYVRAEE